jgi:hypothetical protein
VKFPTPTRVDHQKFCENEGWTPIRDARGRKSGHHITYEYAFSDGRVLRTRVSHPPDRSTYGPDLWSHVLRDQLNVDEATFWACVRGDSPPDRGQAPEQREGLPAKLVFMLIQDCGLPETEVAAMSKEEALAALNEHWSHPKD